MIDRQRGRIICVHEDHTLPGQVINTLVSIDLSGAQAPHKSSSSGNDFYSTPRLSPDGNAPGLADLESSRHAMGRDRGVGRRDPGRRYAGEGSPGRGWSRMKHCSSRNGLPTAISTSSRTEAAAGGISIASETARSNRWRRWRPNLDGRNGILVCRPTRSNPRSGSSAVSLRTAYGIWPSSTRDQTL